MRPSREPFLKRVIAGYDEFGTVHQVLRAWRMEDWPGYPPAAGRVLRCRIDLAGDATDLDEIGGAETSFGLDLARQEAAAFFEPDAATRHRAEPHDAEATLRSALRSCLARGEQAAIWINFADDALIVGERAVPWNGVGDERLRGFWGTWFSQPVIQTNFVSEGELWVASNRCARMVVYPETEGAERIALHDERDGERRIVEARLYCEFSRRDQKALHVISLNSA
jgi:hypothetical protein